jgi:3-phenylpropionate/trans-cinnamate dioxygenase ferredoxin reductase component
MKAYKYLLIGGGMTADAAVHGIREVDPNGKIGLFSLEPDPPYDRPPLTKDLWKGKPIDKIWRVTQGPGVDLYLNRAIKFIDPQKKQITDGPGEIFGYEKLLLATGGTPRRLPFGENDIIYYRTVADYRHLKELSKTFKRFAVMGGGFIGSEIAAGLAMNGREVVMLFPDQAIGARVYPPEISDYLNDFFRQKGVEVLVGETATGLEKRGNQVAITTGSKREIVVDKVIAGIGITPNIDLAKTIDLTITNGIAVDEYLQTSHPDIYAAGDVAEFYDASLGKRRRVEHADNARVMGKMAGRNMAGAHESYSHLPFFYSDLFELGYEAVGDLDSRLETYTDWIDPYRKGVIYYLEGIRVRGVLLWNVWDQVDHARKLIAQSGPFQPSDLKGRLPA